MGTRLTIYRGDPVDELLMNRKGSPTHIVNAAIQHYLQLTRLCMPVLPVSMWLLLFDAANGWFNVGDRDPRLLALQVEDACRLDALHLKWGIAQDDVVKTVRDFSVCEAFAVLFAAERFWDSDNSFESSADYRGVLVRIVGAQSVAD